MNGTEVDIPLSGSSSPVEFFDVYPKLYVHVRESDIDSGGVRKEAYII